MKAMILAAGRGKRMRPLTDNTAKPLLKVNGQPLIEYHLQKLSATAVNEVVINHAWCGDQIEKTLGDGARWGLNISYSAEPAGGLETAGGIINALPLLGEQPFWLINGDVFADLSFDKLPDTLANGDLAHLVMVANPGHNPDGDFAVKNGRLRTKEPGQPSYTYAGLGLYRPQMFAEQQVERLALRPFFEQGIAQDRIAASVMDDTSWTDVGTPQRLQQLNQQLRGSHDLG
ncbi:MAG: N-acetylmuramate alpha-1-phosphate uridylyltransferase MurU [Pseudomonadota bacterium]